MYPGSRFQTRVRFIHVLDLYSCLPLLSMKDVDTARNEIVFQKTLAPLILQDVQEVKLMTKKILIKHLFLCQAL